MPKRCGHLLGKVIVLREEYTSQISAAFLANSKSKSSPLLICRTMPFNHTVWTRRSHERNSATTPARKCICRRHPHQRRCKENNVFVTSDAGLSIRFGVGCRYFV